MEGRDEKFWSLPGLYELEHDGCDQIKLSPAVCGMERGMAGRSAGRPMEESRNKQEGSKLKDGEVMDYKRQT